MGHLLVQKHASLAIVASKCAFYHLKISSCMQDDRLKWLTRWYCLSELHGDADKYCLRHRQMF